MNKDEALRLALEALEDYQEHIYRKKTQEAITAIKAALEAKGEPEQMAKLGWQVIDCPICGGGARAFPKQEVKDEPVAYIRVSKTGNVMACAKSGDFYALPDKTLLYTTPPQRTWVGLTDEEIEQGCKESWVTEQAFQSAVWWAEAKLKEKNETN